MSSSALNEVLLPPVLPDLKDIIENYLLDTESLPIHDTKKCMKFWPTYPEPLRLINPSLNPLGTSLEVERDPATGVITDVKEIFSDDFGTTAKNSFSLKRIPGPPEEAVRGSSTNYPFWPGGIPEPTLLKDNLCNSSLFEPNNYLTKHPKLSRGIEFVKNKDELAQKTAETESSDLEVVNLTDMLKVDESVLNIFEVKEEKKSKPQLPTLEDITGEEAALINELKAESKDVPAPKKNDHVIKISDGASKELVLQGTEWAIVVDINSAVDDFTTKIPNPACVYPFELDTFQKQAILHLENHESVFVAAHTSAGKTVVAEYCIALAFRHMMRAIYTSPIKALSNQKYRDLKKKFEDVGLLTGDIQINAKASCLIMTTEILQSMLYNGSEVVRDLEWVIFDEVHYINNAERGHVWEEVIIMLPSHVNIVLLSATVPNTIEFADWIGRIKKKKIYVISTSKRPVPLEHYLYTGSGGKTKHERFMLVDAEGNFLLKGYNEAVNAKEEKEKKSQKIGPKQKGFNQLHAKQEMTLWIGLLDHLNKNELLPVVAFTLSKKRCDQNALQLMSQDLTSNREKGEIHSFIKKCTERLQGSDKCLPQVILMSNLLKKGIGIHHSGILPIIKEVVEMLFAKGLVKLLFATETFAMGVNMPARSVVFDSIRKHDGIGFRDLVPSEYIQMAGRAGRRGLDTTGTVIILCKSEVPNMINLKNMMLGRPTKLESQFKLTYSMILNLLPVNDLRVEDMMKRSFSEALHLRNQSNYKGELTKKEEELDKTAELHCIMCKEIGNFYATSRDYTKMRTDFMKSLLTDSKAKKMLNLGRLIKISYQSYHNYLACIVKIDLRDSNKYTVLILRNKMIEENNQDFHIMNLCLHAADDSIALLEKTSDHRLLEIGPCNVIGISNKVIKGNFDKVVENVKKREIPRFRDDPPGVSVMEVLTVLQRINEHSDDDLEFLDLISDLGIKNLDAVEKWRQLEKIKDTIKNYQCLECPQFADHFSQAFERLKVSEDIFRLKYLMSEEALQLHPEYQARIKVLRELEYVEENNTVTLKGRIACQMSNHELMITELLLNNAFADMDITEMAALLSSLVFQQKNCSEPSLNEDLLKGIKEFKEVATKIGTMQINCGLIEPVGDFVDQFNFGLCEVVYHWAQGMSFDKITELTDVQEGIIVKCIQRLDETLRDVRNAGKIIGDPNLYEKMEKASAAIKRDIVFIASLYTQ